MVSLCSILDVQQLKKEKHTYKEGIIGEISLDEWTRISMVIAFCLTKFSLELLE